MKFGKKQITRYSRQIILKKIGVIGQKKLLKSSVLIVGAGGLGSPIAVYLTAAGIGKIGIIDQDKIEKIVSAIARRLENSGDTEIKSSLIGEYIMEALSNLDQVAYVRFASVYKNFREVKDFEDFLDNLEEK